MGNDTNDSVRRIADALELLALCRASKHVLHDGAIDKLAGEIAGRSEPRRAMWTDDLVLSASEAARYREWLAAQKTPAASPVTAASDPLRSDRVAPSGGDSGHLSAPQTVDACPACGLVGQWRADSGPPDVCAKCGRGPGHPFAQPQTADVLGSELRVGDCVVAVIDVNPTGFRPLGPWTVDARWTRNPKAFVSRGMGEYESSEYVFGVDTTYRVRLPRPAEPSAPTSHAGEGDETFTKRNAIAKALRDVYCDRTSSILPDPLSWRMAQAVLDLPWEEPSASGEGIARADRLCVTVAYGSGTYTWTAYNEGEASTIAAAVNAAHAHATRELRERVERAEKSLEESCANALHTAASLTRERDAAVKRAEAAECVVEAVRASVAGVVDEGVPRLRTRAIRDLLDAYDTARKDGGK